MTDVVTSHMMLGMPVHYVNGAGKELAGVIVATPSEDGTLGPMEFMIRAYPTKSRFGVDQKAMFDPECNPGTWHPAGR